MTREPEKVVRLFVKRPIKGCGQDEPPIRTQDAPALAKKGLGIRNVLQDLSAKNKVDHPRRHRNLSGIPHNVRCGILSSVIDADMGAIGKKVGVGFVTAANVQDKCRRCRKASFRVYDSILDISPQITVRQVSLAPNGSLPYLQSRIHRIEIL
jgi:hypothetical protein